MIYRLTVIGAPRTKKTSNNAFLLASKTGKGQPCPHCKKPIHQVVAPSKAWVAWVKEAEVIVHASVVPRMGARLKRVRMGKDLVTYMVPNDGRPGVKLRPLSVPLNLEAHYFRDAARGDLFGFHQGLGDFLQEWGIVENDVLIRTTDGSRLRIDRETPRVDLTLTSIEDESEQLTVGLPDEQHQMMAPAPAEDGRAPWE